MNGFPDDGLVPLPADTPSLARRLPLWRGRPFPARTLFALGPDGGYAALPCEGRLLDFGRGVARHVRVGRGDDRVSRIQGTLHHADERWWLVNGGQAVVRVPDHGEPLLTGHSLPLAGRYLPAFVTGHNVHVVELAVKPVASRHDAADDDDPTSSRHEWPLTERQRLVLTVVYQQFLLRTDDPRPISAPDTASELVEITGDRSWHGHRVSSDVDKVRNMLIENDVRGLSREDAPSDMFKVNLYRRLAIDSVTLTPRDLDRLNAHPPNVE